jgi:class 3 adenylate cyclase
VRLIRLVRIFKLWKQVENRTEANVRKNMQMKELQSLDETKTAEGEQKEQTGESETRVGKKLMEMTTRRVIMIVLIMLLATPFLTADAAEMTSMEVGMKDIAVAGPPSKCDGDSSDTYKKLHGCSITPLARDGVGTEEDTKRALLTESALLTYIWAHITKSHPEGFWTSAVYIEMLSDITSDGKVVCERSKRSGKLFTELTKSPEVAAAAKNHLSTLLSYECSFLGGALGDLDPDLAKVSREANNEANRRGGTSYVCMTPGDVDLLWVNITEKLSWEEEGSCIGERNSPYDTKSGDHSDCPGVLINQFGEDLEHRMSGDIRSCPADLRKSERYDEFVYMRDGTYVRILFDTRAEGRFGAQLSLGRTVCVIFVLGISAMFFSRDANALVLMPLENMMSLMRQISKNPLVATTLGRKQQHEKEQEKKRAAKRKGRGGGGGCCQKRDQKQVQTLETKTLETTLVKLGSLLALGLGEAGVEMVGSALAADEFNPSTGAGRVHGIFGYVEVKDFMNATEVLQGKVMVYVNQIAEIVHAMIDEFLGFPNKNLGDAFLVVWKLDINDEERCVRICDLSLMMGVKLMAAVHKSPVLWEYRSHPGLIARIRDFRVNLGLGLHAGWAIEGAIGSEFKIDATYLSPDVNLAMGLELATKLYRSQILMSDTLHKLLSKGVKEHTRWIDSVTLPGSKNATRVYTCDLRVHLLEMEPIYATEFHKVHTLKSEAKMRIRRELRKRMYQKPQTVIGTLLRDDKDFQTMRKGYTANFFRIFSKAILNYECGEWEVAEEALAKSNQVHSVAIGLEDGPGASLYEYMKSYDFKVPNDWKGSREIDTSS